MSAGFGKWWKNVFFGLHYDLHANVSDTCLGAELTHDHLRVELAKVMPDFVQCDCKGHPGYSSYPTKIGSPSPGIIKDALRIHRDVTAELGIPLSVHYSGVWDTRALELHPEWAARTISGDPQGQTGSPNGDFTCRLSPYADELMIPQMLEIIDEYDIDGFWVDGDNWAVFDCYCPRCREEFRRRTGIAQPPADSSDPNWLLWRAFQRDVFVEYVRKYADAVHARKPDCAVCSNWAYSVRMPGAVELPLDYLSGDFTPSFGAERAEMEGRYISSHRMPWNLMAWTFCRTDEASPWQMKTVPHLCQEAAEVMSCGGAVFLYNQPQRSGWLTGWHQDIFAEVAQFCRDRRAYSEHTASLPEAAVLLDDYHVWQKNTAPFCIGTSIHSAEGALHALVENQWHTDVVGESHLLASIDDFQLVVVPEQTSLSAEMLAALEVYVCSGGSLLITGAVVADAYAELAGVEADGEARDEVWHLSTDGEVATMQGPWQPVRARNAEIYAPIMSDQQPDKDETSYPAVTVRHLGAGQVIAIHGDIMNAYYNTHHPRIRRFISRLLEDCAVPRRVIADASPNIEITLRRRDNFVAVHLVNRATNPPLSPRAHIIEQVPAEGPVSLRFRCDAQPVGVTLQPGGRDVAWRYENGWVAATVPQVAIHEILVISF